MNDELKHEDKTNGAADPATPATIAAPTPVQPKIIGQMNELEKSRADNVGLLNENIQLREERLQMEANDIAKAKIKLRDEANKLKQDIIKRLGSTSNPDKIRLRATGDIEEMP